jgi:hypothetical protein
LDLISGIVKNHGYLKNVVEVTDSGERSTDTESTDMREDRSETD